MLMRQEAKRAGQNSAVWRLSAQNELYHCQVMAKCDKIRLAHGTSADAEHDKLVMLRQCINARCVKKVHHSIYCIAHTVWLETGGMHFHSIQEASIVSLCLLPMSLWSGVVF